MIDYAYLCQAIEHWRSGSRPATPPVPSSEYEELDADVMVEDEDAAGGYTGHADAPPSYEEQPQAGHEGYAQPDHEGYDDQAYQQQAQGYEQQTQAYEQPDQSYDEQQGYEQPAQSYDDQAYEQPAQSYDGQGYEQPEQGYDDQGYEEPTQAYDQQAVETYEQPEPGDVTMAYGASVPDIEDDEDR